MYVIYSFGDESLAELYGDEPWRAEQLWALKTKWDYEGTFVFYAPVGSGSNGGRSKGVGKGKGLWVGHGQCRG